MKTNRRRFTCAFVAALSLILCAPPAGADDTKATLPCVISTWPFGKPANEFALETIQNGGSVLDGVEQGIRLVEADLKNTSVGDGGTPAANGVVQLDACIMLGPGHQAGGVAGLEGIRHPITVARQVMEQTPHVLLVGQGAQDFAVGHGHEVGSLLTDQTRAAWEKWNTTNKRKHELPVGADNHDTIALAVVADNKKGERVVAGGCSTSGLGYKLPGRVGDSPILGSGLYVDNEVGAAGATGLGENVMRYCSTFFIVESMRNGKSPQAACVAAIRRVARLDSLELKDLHINFIAIDKDGNVGAAGTDKGFRYAVTNPSVSEVRDAEWVH